MRNKISVIAQQINMSGATTLNLPRNSVHDAYVLKFDMSVKNTHGTDPATVAIKDVLKAIENISLVTDSTRVHYSLSGYDLALLNARMQAYGGNYRVIDIADETVAANATEDYSFVLYLDEGDIIASAHTNVELSVDFNPAVKTNVTLTAATCTVTLKETLYSLPELTAVYGENLERAAEPKVYVLEANVNANSEFNGCLDLPTGTLLKGAVVTFTPSETNKYPEQVGVLRTAPDRVELVKEEWTSHRAVDEIIHKTKFPADMYVLDYTTQWQNNGVGKNGWSYAKGEVQLATKNTKSQVVRYISIEAIVNTDYYVKNVAFSEY